MPRLIITADDCGVSEGINQTIYDLHRQGYISAASVMTNFPAQRHALELLRTCPDLDLGAHLTLTDGFPLSHGGPRHARVLNDDRSFRDKFSLYLCAQFFNASTIDWLRHELDAQLGRFTEVGIEPRHISTHHHFHAIPALRRIVHELAADYGVDWVRGHDFRASFSPRNPFHRAQHKSLGAPFDMPDYMTAIQANMSRPVEDSAGASPAWKAQWKSSRIRSGARSRLSGGYELRTERTLCRDPILDPCHRLPARRWTHSLSQSAQRLD